MYGIFGISNELLESNNGLNRLREIVLENPKKGYNRTTASTRQYERLISKDFVERLDLDGIDPINSIT